MISIMNEPKEIVDGHAFQHRKGKEKTMKKKDECVEHQFKAKTFFTPKFCDICNGFIAGIYRQGVRCSGCGLNAHKRCCTESEINSGVKQPKSTSNVSSKALVGDSFSSSSTLASSGSIESLPLSSEIKCENLDKDDYDCPPSLEYQITEDPKVKLLDEEVNSRELMLQDNEYFKVADKSDFLSQFFQSLAMETINISEKTRREKQKLLPPLSLFAKTPKNMTRFMFRVGCIFDALEFIHKIWSWSNPLETACLFIGSLWLVLYPNFVICLPPLLVIAFLVKFWYVPKLVSLSESAAGSQDKRKRLRRKTKWDWKANVDVKKNLRNLQNLMGIHSDTHDFLQKFVANAEYWDDDVCRLLIKLCIFCCIFLSFISMFISSIKGLVLCHVALFFLSGSSTIQAVVVMILRYFGIKDFQSLEVRLFQRHPKISDDLSFFRDPETSSFYIIYQYQSFSPFAGWTSSGSLPFEPYPWADESGTRSASKTLIDQLVGADENADWSTSEHWEMGIYLLGNFKILPYNWSFFRRRRWTRAINKQESKTTF